MKCWQCNSVIPKYEIYGDWYRCDYCLEALPTKEIEPGNEKRCRQCHWCENLTCNPPQNVVNHQMESISVALCDSCQKANDSLDKWIPVD